MGQSRVKKSPRANNKFHNDCLLKGIERPQEYLMHGRTQRLGGSRMRLCLCTLCRADATAAKVRKNTKRSFHLQMEAASAGE